MNDYWAEQEYTCAPPDPVTTHPIDTEALQDRMRRAVATAEEDGCGAYINPRDLTTLLDALAAAEDRATQAESDRDEWRQAALEERAGLLDALDQLKIRDTRVQAALMVLNEDTRWQNEEHLLARVRQALTA